MGTTKTDSFNSRELRIAQLAKALGHPARVTILQFIINQKSCICGDIVDELPLSQSTVSQHLKELKEAGIIKGEISGAKTCYCIDEKVWQEMEQSFTTFFKSYDAALTCC
jgi:ArsR family transcriptional regulator